MSQTKAQLIDPVDGTIVNADINASAAIAGSKISPDFGSQNIVTTGGLTVDTTTLKVDASNNRVGIGTASPDTLLHAKINTFSDDINKVALTLSNNQSSGVHQYFQNASTGTGVSNGARIGLGNTDNFLIQHFEAKDIQISTNGSEAMRINSSGDIGIGTTSMAGKLNVQGSAGGVALQTTDATNSTFRISHPSAAVTLLSGGSSQHLALGTGFAEKMRIDSSGSVGIGGTAPNYQLHATTNIAVGAHGFAQQLLLGNNSIQSQLLGTGYTNLSLNALGGNVGIGTTSPSTPLHVSTNTDGTSDLLTLHADADGQNANNGIASIKFMGNSNHAAFIKGGHTANGNTILTFHTDAHDSGISPQERMRIDSSGNVGIGSNPLSRLSIAQSVSSGHMMVIRNTQTRANNVRYGIEFRDSSNETNGSIVVKQTGSNNQASFEFYLNNGNGGNGITGGTNGIKSITIGPGGLIIHKEFNMHDVGGTTSAKFLDFGFQGNSCNFRRTNGNDGSHANFMTVNSSNVVSGDFNDTSDEKLKKNILSVVDGAIENIKKLRPVTFDWIDETRNNDVSGFVAQEVKEVLPNLIDGTEYDPTLIDETKGSKGGIKSEGYSINTIGLVAHLTKALQEAIAKIETLETEVAALKAA